MRLRNWKKRMASLTGWTVFFLVVHTHFTMCTSSRWLDSLQSFIEPDYLPLRHAVVHNVTGDVYVAGSNVLYHLGSDLKVKQKVITGPKLDHPDCLHPSYPCDQEKSITNNFNQFLDIVYHMESQMLLLCGTLYGRLCQVRPLDDIASFSWIGPYNESLGFSTVVSSYFNQAFFGPGNSGQLYMAIHDDPNERKPSSAAFLTSKVLVKRNDQFFFEYSFSNDTSSTAVRFEGNTTRLVVDGFIHGKFAYFLILHHPRNGTPDTRLVRVCTEDVTFHSYAELPIYCSYKGDLLLLAFSGFFGDATAQMRQEHQLDHKEKVLYVGFVRYENGVSKGSGICGFPMSSVVEAFVGGRQDCLKDDLIKGATCQLRKKVGIDGDLCTSDNNPYVAEPHHSKILLTYKSDSVFTAFTIVEQNGEGIAIAGMADGSVMKANFGRRTWYSRTFLLDKSQKNEILSPLQFDLSHEHIYFLVSNRVVKFPVRSCSVHDSCQRCMTNAKFDPLQCEWCNGRCAQSQECHEPNSFSRDTCFPVIYEVTPLRGPVKGGTLVQVTGDNFGSFIDERHNLISVAGSPCKIVSWNYTEVKCTLGSTSGEITGPVALNVTDTSHPSRGFNVTGSATSTGIFTYFLVPRLYAIYPSKGPTSGGTHVILYGENLDLGTHRVFNVRGRRCTQMAIDKNSAWCVTGNISSLEFPDSIAIIVDNETFEMEANVPSAFNMSGRYRNFVYLPDPEIHQIHPGITTVSGLMNVTVTGRHLDSVDFPEMVVTIAVPQTAKELEFPEPCWVKPESKGTVLTCRTPQLKRSGIPILTRTHPLLGHVAFHLDIQELRDLPKTREIMSRLLYYPDPEFRPFREVKRFRNNETVMEIEGKHLDIIHTADNLQILIDGSHLCNISTLNSDSLQCNLPPELMSNSSMLGTNISVEVIMGVSRLSLGYMEITEQESGVALWIIITGSVLLVVSYILMTIFVLYCCYDCLKKSSFCAAFQNLHVAEQQMETRTVNDYTPVPTTTESTTLTVQPLQEDDKVVENSFVEQETIRLLKVEGKLILNKFLTLGRQIGQGQFGYVLKGVLKRPSDRDEIEVAVKGLKNVNSSRVAENVAAFLEEALIMKDFRHDNVLTLIGVCFEGPFPLVVLTYMENGDLSTYMRDDKKVIIVKELLKFALDVATGMAYLAVNKFVHRDLAARNCMLDSKLAVKVADFGLSRDIYAREYYSSDNTVTKLPIKWMSPESLEKRIYSEKTDVWSYGVLLWEIMTRGTVPYADVDNEDMLTFLKKGRRMEQPEYCPDDLYIVMLACWNADLEQRPNFDEIEYHICRILKRNSNNGRMSAEPTFPQNTTYYNYDHSKYLRMDGYVLSSEILKDC